MQYPPQPPPDAGGERMAYKWKVLICVIFGIFMVILDTTVVNVAFQTLRREFGASLNDAQWIISIYVLSLGISTPLAGFLADRFGIKRMYILGLATFVTGSLLCGLSTHLWYLVAARALQGVGGGIALPLGTALLLGAFPPKEQGLALGIFGIALVTGPALGPILGGLLVDHELWHWIFFINIPIGIVGVFMSFRFLRERRSDRHVRFDLFGLLTEIVGFGSILYAASIVADHGWNSPPVLLWFATGVAGLALFAFVELYVVKDPLLDLRLYKQRIFLTASLVGYVSVIALFGAEFLMPVYLQALRGYSALQTGFILLPLAATAGISTPTAGRLYDKIGPRMLLVAGFGMLLVNTWQLSQIQADTPITFILLLLAIRGIALGLTVQTTFVTALSVVPMRELARGSSLTNATRQVVQSVGVALLATVLASTLSPQVKAMQKEFQDRAPAANGQHFALCADPDTLAAQLSTGRAATVVASGPGPDGAGVSQLPGAPGGAPGGVPGGAPSGAPGGITGLPPAAIAAGLQRACQESVAGFERAYKLTFFVAMLALLLGATLPGWPFAWLGRGGHLPAGGH